MDTSEDAQQQIASANCQHLNKNRINPKGSAALSGLTKVAALSDISLLVEPLISNQIVRVRFSHIAPVGIYGHGFYLVLCVVQKVNRAFGSMAESGLLQQS